MLVEKKVDTVSVIKSKVPHSISRYTWSVIVYGNFEIIADFEFDKFEDAQLKANKLIEEELK